MNRDWTVLLIGGSGATGKSYLARQLSEYYKLPLTEVDDIRIALQQVVDKSTHPELFTFLDNPNYLKDHDSDYLVNELLSVGKEVWVALDALITKHITCNEPVIFEGDGLIPELLAKRNLDQVKAIFIYDEKENILERELKRSRGGTIVEDLAQKQVEFSYAYGQEIKKQAENNNFAVIEASPLETLLNRVKMLLEQ